MAENDFERTEAPTPRRRQEARERGQVAKSADLTAALILLGGVICLAGFGPGLVRVMLGYATELLGPVESSDLAHVDVMHLTVHLLLTSLTAVGPVLAALLALGLLSNVLQVGFLLSGQPLQPKLEKLNPINGLTRMFSGRTGVQLVMNLLKLGLIVALVYQLMRDQKSAIASAVAVSGWQQLSLFGRLTYDFGVKIGGALVVLALLDYIWQRVRFERDLRMTKEEVKEEMRRMEGDPIVRQRRRQLQMRLAMQRLQRDVPKADVVVTNPTELAIAIQYDQETMTAPKVVAKGQGFMAQKIREIAAEHGIPIVERKPLAQALFKTVEVGHEVPADFYQAVAEILAYVYELSRQQGRRRVAMVE